MKNLIFLTLGQNYKFEELAELSVLLPTVASKELKAWQYCEKGVFDIKVNGKHKPYLDSNFDKDKILFFENEFTKLQEKFRRQ